MYIGLGFTGLVALWLIAVLAGGGDARTWPGLVIGLVVAAIGFGIRVLAALENKSAPND